LEELHDKQVKAIADAK